MGLLYVEGIVLLVIIYYQFKNFLITYAEIGHLKRFYPLQPLERDHIMVVTYENVDVEQLSIPDHLSDGFQSIIQSTNSYLRNNKGSADFNIIKSISERVSDAEESAILSSITTPLYLGLMGTFIGVILGLIKIIGGSGEKLLQGDALGVAINSLLLGVGIAMVASFFGLALTTYNNVVVFKSAVAVRNQNKNNYYNFLQTDLLPNLDNNLYSALNLLKQNIGEFNHKFTDNLKLFDKNFGDNILLLKSAVGEMSGQITGINENTKSQVEFLAELRRIDYNTLAKANIKMFDKMKDTAPLLAEFVREQQALNENIHTSNKFVEKLGVLMNRVAEFENSINGLGREIQQSEMLGGEVIGLIKRHLNSIDMKESLISEYASKSYSDVKDYLTIASEKVAQLKRKIEIDFEHAFDFNAEGNLMQNLSYLKSIDEGIGRLHQDSKSKSLMEEDNNEIVKINFDQREVESKASIQNASQNNGTGTTRGTALINNQPQETLPYVRTQTVTGNDPAKEKPKFWDRLFRRNKR